LRFAGKLSDWAKVVRRGYAGWLSLNTEFIPEHDHLFKLYRCPREHGSGPALNRIMGMYSETAQPTI